MEDSRYGGKIHVELNSDGTYTATKLIPLRSKEELNSMVSLIMKRSKLVHRNFSTIRRHDILEEEDYCVSMATLSSVYDYYDNDLEKQIARRARLEDHFPEERICAILCQIAECLKYLEDRGCYHGDIKPANIFFDRAGAVKLLDSYFTHLGKSNFELVLSSPTNLSYLSPSQLANLRKGNYSGSNEDKYKNQVFSLGMTAMEAMLLRNSFECYDLNLLKVLEPKIKERMAEVKGLYSQNLVNLLGDMLLIDEAKRPSAAQILNHPAIRPYTNKISLAGGILPASSVTPSGTSALNGNSRPGFFKNSGKSNSNKLTGSSSRSLLPVFRNS